MIRALCIAAALIATPAFAAAPCRTQGSTSAAVVAADPANPSALLSSIPVVVKLHGLTGASLAAFPQSCDRGAFTVGARTYTLTGENADPNVPRRAASADKTAPLAVLAEVFDLEPALAAAPQPGGEPRGVQNRYALATTLNDVMVVWRVYDAVPDDARLKADIAAAMTRKMPPIMRFDMKGGGPVQFLIPSPEPATH